MCTNCVMEEIVKNTDGKKDGNVILKKQNRKQNGV
jgi:hypothetical protein